MLTDTDLNGVTIEYYFYISTMENQNNSAPVRSLQDWQNEVEYFEMSMHAIQQVYGLINDMKRHAQLKVDEICNEQSEYEEQSN